MEFVEIVEALVDKYMPGLKEEAAGQQHAKGAAQGAGGEEGGDEEGQAGDGGR